MQCDDIQPSLDSHAGAYRLFNIKKCIPSNGCLCICREMQRTRRREGQHVLVKASATRNKLAKLSDITQPS